MKHRVAAAAALLAMAMSPARANALFTFDGVPLDTQIAPSYTLGAPGGLQATFIDSVSPPTCDPIPGECGYLVRDPLETEVVNGVTQYRFNFTFTQHLVALGFGHDPLTIDFSSPLSSFAAPFGVRFPDSLDAVFSLNGIQVGAFNFATAVPPGHEFPEGTISYSGALFDSVTFQTPVTTYYPNGEGNPPTLVGNVSFTLGPVDVPEPASLLLLGGALLGLAARRRA